MKKLIKHLIGDVKEFEDGYTGTESNSSIYIAIIVTIILMMGICVKGFSNDAIKKPNIIDGNNLLTNKIYTSIDGINY